MRSVVVTVLIVLQHAAQLPCRSVTRSSLRSSTRAPPPTPASHEDIETIISRNREITDLLIPLLEANLEAKRHDQNKRNDLLKVFPYRENSKSKKEPLVELLRKRKSTRKTPLALILASELRSRKGKKSRGRVHAQKAFLIHNEDKADSSEEDYGIDSKRNRKNKLVLNKYVVKNKSLDKIDENNDVDVQSKENNKITFNNSDESKNIVASSESNSSEEGYDIDINVKDNQIKKNDLNEDAREESNDVSKSENEIKQKQPHIKTKQKHLNDILVNSNSGDDESNDDDDIEVIKSDEKHGNSNKYGINRYSDDKSENDIQEDIENETDDHSDETVVEISDKINNLKHGYSQSTNSESFEVLREFDHTDVSKEHVNDIQHVLSENYQSHHDRKSSSKESDNSEEHNKSDSIDEPEDKIKFYALQENNLSEILNSGEGSVSNEGENKNDDKGDSEQSSDSAVVNKSEENQINEGHDKGDEEKIPGDDDHVINENKINESDQYASESLADFDYHENVESESYEKLSHEHEEGNTSKESNESESYEKVSNNKNSSNNNAENENNRKKDYNASDSDVDIEDSDEKAGTSVETSGDDTLTVNDDSYNVNSADHEFESVESKKPINSEEITNQSTFSHEIAEKYADDSKYTVENDHSLVETSGELSKFNVESVEGLLEVLQQDHEINDKICEEKEKDEIVLDEEHANHSHEVHKSYKLSFKFNK